MANRYAVKSGNWSDVTVWDGGASLPGPADVVTANAKIVTIDQDIEVYALANKASLPAVSGGGYVISSVTGTLTVNLLGGILGGSYGGAGGLFTCQHANETTVVVIANIVAFSSDMAPLLGKSGIVFVSGSIYGGVAGNGYATMLTETCKITVSGNVESGTGANSWGLFMRDNTSATVQGNVVAASGAPAILTNYGVGYPNVIFDLLGEVRASSSYPGISAAGMLIRVRTLVDAPNGRKAILAPGWIVPKDANFSETVYRDDTAFVPNATQTLTSYVSDSPPPADVRKGVVYGPGHDLTGVLAMPTAGQVASGVPVDAVEGTAALDAANVWTQEVAPGLSAGVRLLSNSTPASTGAQLAQALDH